MEEGTGSTLKHLRLFESSPLNWTEIYFFLISFNSGPIWNNSFLSSNTCFYLSRGLLLHSF